MGAWGTWEELGGRDMVVTVMGKWALMGVHEGVLDSRSAWGLRREGLGSGC